LLRVGGFGKKRLADHGKDVLEMVTAYVQEHQLVTDLLDFASTAPKAPPKPDTKKLTLDLHLAGKTIAEIAAERELTEGTISGHLAHWVGTGDLPITVLVSQAEIDLISPYLLAHPDLSLGEVFRHFEEKYSYGALRVVRKFLE